MMKVMLAGLALVFASAPAFAGTPWVDKREHRQAVRIYKGVQNGELTFREASRLVRGQAHVRRLERFFKSDGVVTPWERAQLHAALNRQSARIYMKKHN